MKFVKVVLGALCRACVVDTREDTSVRARIRDNAPHPHYALDREDIRIELSAFRMICESIGIKGQWTVLELFGGSGWHTALIQAILMPIEHLVIDISNDCAESISRAGNNAKVLIADSLNFVTSTREVWDWVHADYNLLTLEKMSENEALRNSALAVFKRARNLVTITTTEPWEIQERHYHDGAPQHNASLALIKHFKEAQDWYRAFTGWTLEEVYCWGPAAMMVFRQSDSTRNPQITFVNEPMEITVEETVD